MIDLISAMKQDNKKKIILLEPYQYNSIQFFLQWCFDACALNGFQTKKRTLKITDYIRRGITKLKISRNISHLTNGKEALLILSCVNIDYFAFPYAYNKEIIPVLWDTWPRHWSNLIASLKRHHVKCAFFTQSQTAAMVKEAIPSIHCFHLIEGIDPSEYKKGDLLINRTTDLLELGRVHERFNDAITDESVPAMKVHLFRKKGLLFPDFESLINGISDAKITICFPQCDTHPERAEGIETMTQRYWECMLSRTLILGRAPAELLDFMGYNPVIEVDWSNPPKQLNEILDSIDSYQELVDKNYAFALEHSSWNSRVPYIKACLEKAGYTI